MRREHVEQRLRAEDLPDRRRERRRADLRADAGELVEHLVEPVAGGLGAQARVDARDEARGQSVLGCADGDPRRERRDRLVADVLVDDLRGLPERVDVDARVEAEAGERLRERLARDAVDGERDRIDGARREIGAGPDRLERGGQRVAARALAVDADGQPARLADALDQLGCAVRAERAGRVVDDDARSAELGQLARLLDERVDLARDARAVDEPRLELALRLGDRLGGLAQVRDVVERVVQPEDVDPVLRRRGDEPPRELAADRPRADEEAAAQRQPERRLDARLDRADALPRALDAAPDGAVEDAAARDLEVARSRRGRGSRRGSSSSAVGTRPASGSCPSSRIVVSASFATRGTLSPQ